MVVINLNSKDICENKNSIESLTCWTTACDNGNINSCIAITQYFINKNTHYNNETTSIFRKIKNKINTNNANLNLELVSIMIHEYLTRAYLLRSDLQIRLFELRVIDYNNIYNNIKMNTKLHNQKNNEIEIRFEEFEAMTKSIEKFDYKRQSNKNAKKIIVEMLNRLSTLKLSPIFLTSKSRGAKVERDFEKIQKKVKPSLKLKLLNIVILKKNILNEKKMSIFSEKMLKTVRKIEKKFFQPYKVK